LIKLAFPASNSGKKGLGRWSSDTYVPTASAIIKKREFPARLCDRKPQPEGVRPSPLAGEGAPCVSKGRMRGRAERGNAVCCARSGAAPSSVALRAPPSPAREEGESRPSPDCPDASAHPS
jgi:hypothetical protein